MKSRLYADLLRQLHNHEPTGVLSALAIGLILVYFLWGVTAHSSLVIWFSANVLIGAVRYTLLRKHVRSAEPSFGFFSWNAWFIIITVLSGTLWGSAAVYLFPIDSILHQSFIAFVLGGMVAGAAGTLSVLMEAFNAYSLPVLLLLTLKFFSVGDKVHIAMGIMVLIYSVLILSIARSISATTRSYIEEKDRSEELNRELESEITDRIKAEEERERLISELQEALSKVKTLSGLLPICSSCKKIRDDKGYWNQIESYIKRHSEADFTHSICPDCTAKLYGKLLKP